MAFCNNILYTVDFVDTFNGFVVHLKWIRCTPEADSLYTRNGFVVHLKWIRCTPEVDFVDTFSLNISITPHTETALFIAISTHKPALLRNLSRANLYIGFLQQYSVHRGFCGYL